MSHTRLCLILTSFCDSWWQILNCTTFCHQEVNIHRGFLYPSFPLWKMQYAVVFFAFSIQSMWSLSSKKKIAGFWARVCQISTWLWILVSWPRPTITLSSSPSSSSMPLISLRRLGTVGISQSTEIWRPTLSTHVTHLGTSSQSTLRTGAKMRTAMEISSLHFWTPSLSFSTIGRPNCGPGCTASLDSNVSVLTTKLFPLGFVPVIQIPSDPVSVMLQSKFLMWICLQIAVFLHRCHMIDPSHAWPYACNVQVHAIMYLNDVQRAAFYEGIGLDTGVGGIWTSQRHRTTDICEE